MNFFNEIKDRKVRKFLAIYFSAAITTIGLVHLFSLRYQLPTFIFDTLLIFLLFGVVSVIVIAWRHGKEGRQKIKIWEYIFHSILFLIAVLTSYLIAQQGPVKILSLNSKTIAVLPFINMSDSKDDEYFSDGITEDILTQLSKISELKVISRTSVMKFKNSKKSIPEIANELGVGTILEGSVRRSGDKVRISSQLINANSDEHIWAETFDRKVDDIFTLQSDIAKHIANELEAQLAPKEKLLIEIKPTNNIEAYAFCLKGRDFASKYTNEDNEKAIEFYKKALDIDSNYALAYAGLASAYDQKVRRYYYPENWRDSAFAMSNKALKLNPNLAEAHSSLAKSYEATEDYKLAKYHYEEAIRLNPNYYGAIYNLGVVYLNEDKLDRALKLFNNSILLEPDNEFGYIVLGVICQKLNCDNLAGKWFDKALQLDSNDVLTHVYLIDHYILKQDLIKAEEYLTNLKIIAPQWAFTKSMSAKLEIIKHNFNKAKDNLDMARKITQADKEYDYAYVLQNLNKNKEARKILENQLIAYLEEIDRNPYGSSTNEKSAADIYSLLGEKQKSLAYLERAINKGYIDYRQVMEFPYLDLLKSDAKFSNLIEMMRNKVDSIKVLAKNDYPDLEECR